MDAIILAGGQGLRLRSLFPDLPKALVPINGRPFMDILLDYVAQYGVKRVILSVGYQSEKIKSYYQDKPYLFSEETISLGTGGALKKALELVETEEAFVFNGDTLFAIDLFCLAKAHHDKRADLTIACRPMRERGRYGTLHFDEEHRITTFKEKEVSENKGWINGGIYVINKQLLEKVPLTIFSLENEIFPTHVHQHLFAFPSEAKFIDVGTEESYFHAQEVLK